MLSARSEIPLAISLTDIDHRHNIGGTRTREEDDVKRIAVLTVALVVIASTSLATTLIAIGWANGAPCPVGSIDTATGAWTLIGETTGFDRCNSLTRDAAGVFYSVAANRAGDVLITIDTGTGAATQLALLNPLLNIKAIAYSPSGVLYAVVNLGAGGNDLLYTIDAATGNETLVGDMGIRGIQGLAFHPVTGDLYAADVSGAGLMTVDLATGAATDVNPDVGGAVQSITVLPDGTIFGVWNDLYSIDPVTGVHTQIATGGYPDLRGVDFTGPIPVELMGFTIE
jgi:DNA-binding beta-propeller fold protein YncE